MAVVVVGLVEAPLAHRQELLEVLVGAGFLVVREALEIHHQLPHPKEVMAEQEAQVRQITEQAVVAALLL
jgi:hypothetical protein